MELHTFSSLNKDFIPQYAETLNAADKAIVFFNEHTLKMKNMPPLDEAFLISAFGHPDLEVFTDEKKLRDRILDIEFEGYNILLMTSGNFNKMEMGFS
jgi:UDP-N-acetylmuramate: L-alanyl-gamma-D-glutamyl-meso-diaminopimelate ligase